MSTVKTRPQTAYGNRRQSSGYLSISPEKYPPRVEELVEKKIVSEFNFNKHARLRRHRSELPQNALVSIKSQNNEVSSQNSELGHVSRRRHKGDENLVSGDLTASLPARMSTLDVGSGRKNSRSEWSPVTSGHLTTGHTSGHSLSGQSSPANRSRGDLSKSHESDEDLWSLMSRSDRQTTSSMRRPTVTDQLSLSSNHPKLSMMKKKLSPLPNRHRMKSLPSNDDDLMTSKRDLSPL